MIPGVNAPPMHPWCRSTTVPHVGSWRDKFFKEREGKYQVEDDTTKDELQQAKVLGKKIYITDQAIDKVRYVDIPTHTKEENQFIQEQHKALLKDAKENNDSNIVYLLHQGKKKQNCYLTVNRIQLLCYITILGSLVFLLQTCIYLYLIILLKH